MNSLKDDIAKHARNGSVAGLITMRNTIGREIDVLLGGEPGTKIPLSQQKLRIKEAETQKRALAKKCREWKILYNAVLELDQKIRGKKPTS